MLEKKMSEFFFTAASLDDKSNFKQGCKHTEVAIHININKY